ncbi:MAG: hypothetical protein CMJ34_13455 [Phycisphaerae bacterium]|nr:hypothetical protein [Phycisphaerae bacterium]
MRTSRPTLLLLPFLTLGCGSDAGLGAVPKSGLEGDEPGECSDGADNDVDGLFDCEDPDCEGSSDCEEPNTEGPSAPGVAISPLDPTSSDDLSCSVTTPAADPQGAAVSYTYTWRRDGVDTAVSTELLAARETTRGETWTCVVTPTADGRVGTAGASDAAIGNTAPEAPTVYISPADPLEGVDALVCTSGELSDADGDSLAGIVSWQVDGVAATAGTTTLYSGDTQPADRTEGDQSWTCTLTLDDGHGGTAQATASTTIAPCDADGDGHELPLCGGGDCDDSNEAVNPGMEEICGNGLDDDCDGTAGGCSPLGELDLDDMVGFRTGEVAYGYAGHQGAGGFDLDGDGNEDWVSGAYAHSADTEHSGLAWVLSGPVRGTASLSTATARIQGTAGDFMGHSVLMSPDLSGDGWPDVVAGASAWRITRGEGAAYLFAGPVSGEHSPSTATASFEGTEVDGRVGWALAHADDIDGRGTAALVVGCYGLPGGGTERGGAYLLAGPLSGSLGPSDAHATVVGEEDEDHAGAAVAAADVDGDGITDLLLGAWGADEPVENAGALYVVLGPSTGTVSLADADERLAGEDMLDNAGVAVAIGGDLNADGLPDVLVGAPWKDLYGSGARQGQVYVVYGPMTVDELYSAQAELLGHGSGDRTGMSVAPGGDVDGDGFDDALVGAMENRVAGEHAGAAYVAYGPISGRVDLATTGARIRGEPGDILGVGVTASDQDGDGYDDIMVGLFYDDTAAESAGAVAFFPGGGM